MPLTGEAKREYNRKYRVEHLEDIKDTINLYKEAHREELRLKDCRKNHHRKILLKKNDLVICQCRICGQLFYVPRAIRTRNCYCGGDCRRTGIRQTKRLWERVQKEKSKDERRLKICRNCGKLFMRPLAKASKYCSEKCRKEGYRKRLYESIRRRRKWLAMAGVTRPFILRQEIVIERAIRSYNKGAEDRG
jgi:hypothetical protein